MLVQNFFLYYQPIYFLHMTERGMQILGYEALLRHKSGCSPLELLDEARRTGVLSTLELEILRTAISQVLLRSPHLLFFNVTSEAFGDASFAVKAERVLREIGVSPARVCIEVSERNLYDPERFEASLSNWVDMGFYTAIDDFGSMRSNIDIVLTAKPDYVKVDRLLVSGVHEDAVKQKLLTSLIETFAVSGIYPILEGIEERKDLDWVLSKGWDVGGQGFVLAAPSAVLTFPLGSPLR